MNYSQSEELKHLIGILLENVSTHDSRELGAGLKQYVDEKVKDVLSKQNTVDTWAATKSELAYVNTLKGIVKALAQGDPKYSAEYLTSVRDSIEAVKPPVKVAFFTQEYFVWPSFQSIWEHCSGRDDCETRLVYVYSNGKGRPLYDENYYKNVFEYRENGYPLLEMTGFSLEEESPDIVFYMKPYYYLRACPPKFYVDEISKHTPYTAFISYCLDVQGGNKLLKFFYGMPAFYRMWKVVAYSRYYYSMMKKYGFRNGDNAVLLGHPKFDFTYRALVKREFQNKEWAEKIAGRPVVLWNSHFSVEENGGVGTYFIWKDTIFNYFKRNKDIVLLWRPHPIFWQTIRQQPGFDLGDFTEFLNSLRASDNVIVDDSSDYRYAFSMSDALISDAATFLVEYCGAGQPVLYTPKKNGEFIINEDYLRGIDSAETAEDILAFLDNVKKQDNKDKDKRIALFKEQFGESDGRNGERIYNHLLEAMKEECRNRAEAVFEKYCSAGKTGGRSE